MRKAKLTIVSLVIVLVLVGLCSCNPIEGDTMEDLYITNAYPSTGGTYDLGSPALPWGDIYTDNIYVNGVLVSRVNYAEMYRYNSVDATNIQVANAWHLITDFTTGEVGGGWVFHGGEQVPITAYADNGDGKTVVTSAGHLLIDNDIISIAGTANYDGVWIVEQVLVNTFVIDTAFVADDGASVGEHGGHFISGAALAAGKYLVTYSLSVKPSGVNDIIEVAIFLNAAHQTKSTSRTKLGAITDYQNVVGFSILDIPLNGSVSLGLRNLSAVADFTIIHGNMVLSRID